MFELFSIAGNDRRFFSGDDFLSYSSGFPSEDISFFPISIMQKDDPGCPVRIVFYACYLSRYIAFIIAPEVYDPIKPFVASTHPSGSDPPCVVSSSGPPQ